MDLDSKCKTLFVMHSCTLRDFMNDHRLEISPSNAFYQLNRPVTVEGFRNIIARKKSSVTFIEKSSFLSAIDIPSSDSIELKDVHLADFDVFVQSTSYTQLLNAETEFLYTEEIQEEAENIDDAQTDVNENGSVASVHASPVKVPTRAVGPPGTQGHEVVICFDTTGSMGACIKEVCKQAPDVFQHLFREFPDLRIAPFAHGDYIDRFKYVTTFTDFTQDAESIKDWMSGVESTYGGDWEECYELALHEIRTQLTWTSGTKRSLVMIGDAIPHEPHLSEAKLDWQAELDALVNDLGVRVYAVQHGSNDMAKDFWHTLARRSGGKHLILKEFHEATDMVVAICHREYGVEKLKTFIDDVEVREKAKGFTELKNSLTDIFRVLSGQDNAPSILRENSVVGRTVDFENVKRRLAEMDEEEKKVAAAPAAVKEGSSRKRKMAAAVGESGTPAKREKPLSAEKEPVVNGGSGSDAEDGKEVKKVVKVGKKKKELGKKSEENVVVKKKKKMGDGPTVVTKKIVTKKTVVEKKKVAAQMGKRIGKSGEEEKTVVVRKKKVNGVVVAGKKLVVDKKDKKKSDEVVLKKKKSDEAKKKLIEKKKKLAAAKKIAEQKKKLMEKKKKLAESKKLAEKKKKAVEDAKKLAAAKKLGEQKRRSLIKTKKLTEAKKSLKTVKKSPVKKTVVKKSENKTKKPTAAAAKKVLTAKEVAPKKAKSVQPPKKTENIAVVTSTSKRRAAQSASCAWEMLKKHPKSAGQSQKVTNGKVTTVTKKKK